MIRALCNATIFGISVDGWDKDNQPPLTIEEFDKAAKKAIEDNADSLV